MLLNLLLLVDAGHAATVRLRRMATAKAQQHNNSLGASKRKLWNVGPLSI